MWENTLLFFISDNGGPLAQGAVNTPLRAGKHSDYEGGIRVPFLVCWPGKLKPGESQAPVIALDILPTVLAATGVAPAPTDKPFDGINILPLLRGETAPLRRSLSARAGQDAEPGPARKIRRRLHPRLHRLRALRSLSHRSAHRSPAKHDARDWQWHRLARSRARRPAISTPRAIARWARVRFFHGNKVRREDWDEYVKDNEREETDKDRKDWSLKPGGTPGSFMIGSDAIRPLDTPAEELVDFKTASLGVAQLGRTHALVTER